MKLSKGKLILLGVLIVLLMGFSLIIPLLFIPILICGVFFLGQGYQNLGAFFLKLLAFFLPLIIFLAMLASLLFYHFFSLPYARNGVNEYFQNNVESTVGIGKLAEAGRALMKSKDSQAPLPNLSGSLSKNQANSQVKYVPALAREGFSPAFVVLPCLLENDKDAGHLAFRWGKDIYAVFEKAARFSFYIGFSWFYPLSLLLMTISYFGLVPILVLLKPSVKDSLFPRIIFFWLGGVGLLFPLGMAIIGGIDYCSYKKDLSFSLSASKDAQESLYTEGLKLLRSEKGTKLISSPPELLKGSHIRSAFVAKRDFLSLEYLRLDLNFCNYLFLAPGLKETSELNPVMKFTKLRDGLWLASYDKLIESYRLVNTIAFGAILFSILSFYLVVHAVWAAEVPRHDPVDDTNPV
ncbi:MAG: hypothetical protein A2X49_05115 [Lentisphaerae bacterium GWF2_52_8]|nr:MAG: hypothetical protein A2X49_05115 [Lentisphaerae bacterium GWF2_52_8]